MKLLLKIIIILIILPLFNGCIISQKTRNNVFKAYTIFCNINVGSYAPDFYKDKFWYDTIPKGKITILFHDIQEGDTFELYINNKKMKEFRTLSLPELGNGTYSNSFTYDYSRDKYPPIMTIRLRNKSYYEKRFNELVADSINVLHSANEYYDKFYDSLQLPIDERYRFVSIMWIEDDETWYVTYSNFIPDLAE